MAWLISAVIHRHTGGLEKAALDRQTAIVIHRHTGGLEKQDD